MVWSRQEFGDAYAYKPVFETKVTANQQLYEVIVENEKGETETYLTTAEHPFYVDGFGWLKASLLAAGMPLLDKNGHSGSLKVRSQAKLERCDTVYNLEVEDYSTYHIGIFGIWVHNECCNLLLPPKTAEQRRLSAGTAYPSALQSLPEIKMGENWINRELGEAPFPKQIAEKMYGRHYNNFNEFKSDFWKEVAKDPVLSKQFSISNRKDMEKGNSPFAPVSQQVGGRKVFELDHNHEIQNNGLVYDFNNIIIRTPKNHIQKTKDTIQQRKSLK